MSAQEKEGLDAATCLVVQNGERALCPRGSKHRALLCPVFYYAHISAKQGCPRSRLIQRSSRKRCTEPRTSDSQASVSLASSTAWRQRDAPLRLPGRRVRPRVEASAGLSHHSSAPGGAAAWAPVPPRPAPRCPAPPRRAACASPQRSLPLTALPPPPPSPPVVGAGSAAILGCSAPAAAAAAGRGGSPGTLPQQRGGGCGGAGSS